MGAPYIIINHIRKQYIMDGTSSMYCDELKKFCPYYVKLFLDGKWSINDDIEINNIYGKDDLYYHTVGIFENSYSNPCLVKLCENGDEEVIVGYEKIFP